MVENEESRHSEAPTAENGLSSPEPVSSPSKGKRRLRVQTPSSEGEQAVARYVLLLRVSRLELTYTFIVM